MEQPQKIIKIKAVIKEIQCARCEKVISLGDGIEITPLKTDHFSGIGQHDLKVYMHKFSVVAEDIKCKNCGHKNRLEQVGMTILSQ